MRTSGSSGSMRAAAALLALLAAARAACPPHHTPTRITAKTSNGFTYASQNINVPYGEHIILNCSSKNNLNLRITENGEEIAAQENTSNIEFCVDKLNIGSDYTYNCVDRDTDCKKSLTIRVTPAMTVESTRVQHKRNEYFVPLGQEYEVLCWGPDSKMLSLYDTEHQQTGVIVNSTTVKLTARADAVLSSFYFCKVNGTSENEVKNIIEVMVDYYPTGLNFYCILHYYTIVECSWSYAGAIIKSNLFYIDHLRPEETTVLCSDYSGEHTNCKVNEHSLDHYLFHPNRNVSFVLNSCNSFLCVNQTLNTNTDAILKPFIVLYIKKLNTSSSAVFLKWSYMCNNCEYKLEYQVASFGEAWQRVLVNPATVRCDDDDKHCRYSLALPYPDTEYKVRVSQRLSTATDERLWSEPRSTFTLVRTAPAEQCECAVPGAPGAPAEPRYSSQAASCDMCSFREHLTKRNRDLQNLMQSSLKRKRALIKNMIEAKDINRAYKKMPDLP